MDDILFFDPNKVNSLNFLEMEEGDIVVFRGKTASEIGWIRHDVSQLKQLAAYHPKVDFGVIVDALDLNEIIVEMVNGTLVKIALVKDQFFSIRVTLTTRLGNDYL